MAFVEPFSPHASYQLTLIDYKNLLGVIKSRDVTSHLPSHLIDSTFILFIYLFF